MYQPTPAGEAFQIEGVWYQDYNVMDETIGQVVVRRYMHNGTEWVPAQQSIKVDILKKIPDTTAGISLKKNVVNLDKCLVNLSKSSGLLMDSHRARVAVVCDFSGSMRQVYKNGAMQRTLTRLVPLGLRFDDNGELDVWLFHSGYRRIEGIDLTNFETYVDETILGSGERFGCTSYAPVLEDILRKYVREHPCDIPSYVIFITDGSNDDKRDTDNIIRRLSEYNVFVQFVGLGTDDDFHYLKKLDDLSGRRCDNTGFIEVADFDGLTDEQLYYELLVQYVDWLKVMGIK